MLTGAVKALNELPQDMLTGVLMPMIYTPIQNLIQVIQMSNISS